MVVLLNFLGDAKRRFSTYKSFKRTYAKKFVDASRDKRDKILKFIDNLVSLSLIDDQIINELGASFSDLKRDGSKIKKFSSKPEGEKKLRDEIRWYLKLRELLPEKTYKAFFPEIFEHSLDDGNVYYVMRHYSLPTLRTLIFEYKIKENEILKRVESIIGALVSNVYSIHQTIPTPADYTTVCHYENIKNRLKYAEKMNPEIKIMTKNNILRINGTAHINAPVLLSAAFRNKEILKKLKPPKLWVIHGDVHYNNVLSHPFRNRVIFLDCRGRSPYGTDQCDVSIDIGKLYHECRSYYSIIERNEYTLFLREKKGMIDINFEFTNKRIKNLYDRIFNGIQKILEEKLSQENFGNWKYRAEFIEGKLYISMLPFHMENFSEAVVCYATGVIRLNEWMAKYHPVLYKSLQSRLAIT